MRPLLRCPPDADCASCNKPPKGWALPPSVAIDSGMTRCLLTTIGRPCAALRSVSCSKADLNGNPRHRCDARAKPKLWEEARDTLFGIGILHARG
jgi:hypothetical protein